MDFQNLNILILKLNFGNNIFCNNNIYPPFAIEPIFLLNKIDFHYKKIHIRFLNFFLQQI